MMGLLVILLFIGGYALSYGVSIGLMYLICLCFSWEFNILIATGIWFVLCLIWGFIPKGR